MKKYLITEIVTYSYKYEIEADDENEARELFDLGEAEHIPGLDSTDYTQIDIEEIK